MPQAEVVLPWLLKAPAEIYTLLATKGIGRGYAPLATPQAPSSGPTPLAPPGTRWKL